MAKPPAAAKPPLLVWLFVALATAGLLGWIYLRHERTTLAAATALDEELLARAARAGERPLVLVIGTSLIQSGLDSSSRISRCVEAGTGKNIQLLKCWQSGGDLARLTSGHTALFEKLHPSVVLVEANMLFYRPLRTPFLSLYMQTFRDLLVRHSQTRYDPDERAEIVPAERAAIENARSGLIDTTDLATFRKICAGWQRNGARIGLVNIPLEETLENKKWHSPDTAGFYSNLRFLRQTGPVSWNDAGLRLDSSYFFDFGHLNRKGNETFAPWFCRLLSAEVSALPANIKTTGP